MGRKVVGSNPKIRLFLMKSLDLYFLLYWLAVNYWVRSTIKLCAVSSGLLINLGNIKIWECQASNLEPLGKKQVHCAMRNPQVYLYFHLADVPYIR